MGKLLAILLVLLTAFSANAEVLRLGRSVSDTDTGLTSLKEIGEYIVKELKGDTYTSYKLYTDGHSDNRAFIKLINSEKIDMVLESMYSAALYAKHTDMEPVLLIRRGNSVYERSYIVARKDSDMGNIGGLSGRTVAFTDKVSATSYFLPAEDIKAAGMKLTEVEQHNAPMPKGTVGILLTHDKFQVANSVYLRKTDAGAVNSADWDSGAIYPEFIKDGLKIIHETRSIPGLFIMIRKDMPAEVRNKIINIFTDISFSTAANPIFDKCRMTGIYKVGFNWEELFKSVPDRFDVTD